MLYTHTHFWWWWWREGGKRDERRRHLLQMIRFEMRRFYNGRYSPFIACGRLQSWPSKKSFPSCQPAKLNSHSVFVISRQPARVDRSKPIIHPTASKSYLFFIFILFFQRKDRELYNILRVDGPRANPLGPVCETGKKRKGSRAKPYR
jgi:hypothetical protein